MKQDYPIVEELLSVGRHISRNRPSPLVFDRLSGWSAEIYAHTNVVIRKGWSEDKRRTVVIVGPCSYDGSPAFLEYARRMKELQDKRPDLLIILRMYTVKPRSKGGWKGYLLDGSPQDYYAGKVTSINERIGKIRETIIEVAEIGLPVADEILYPELSVYFEDLLSYGVLGARTSNSQPHREYLSRTIFPCGIKNSTSGDIDSLLNAVESVSMPHSYVLDGFFAKPADTFRQSCYGNIVLRGISEAGNCNAEEQKGLSKMSGLNYNKEYVEELMKRMELRNMSNLGIIVDLSHANSGKDPFRQSVEAVLNEVNASTHSIFHGDVELRYRDLLVGYMIESYMLDGNQGMDGGVEGLSYTDGCLGVEKTIELISSI